MNQKIKPKLFKRKFLFKANKQNRVNISHNQQFKMFSSQNKRIIIRNLKRINLMLPKIRIRNESSVKFCYFF